MTTAMMNRPRAAMAQLQEVQAQLDEVRTELAQLAANAQQHAKLAQQLELAGRGELARGGDVVQLVGGLLEQWPRSLAMFG